MLLIGLASAGSRPTTQAAYLHRLQTGQFAYAYGAAGHDALRRARVGPRTDTLAPLPQATDRARQPAARPRWPADSLGRLLGYVRLAHDFRDLHRPDSAAHYLGRAWRLAGARQGQQQPTVVIRLADELAGLHYDRGNYDSTLYYYQRAARQFRAAGFDSSLGPVSATARRAGARWPDGAPLPGILANAGSACRALGRLPLALRYYERARRLFQQQVNLSGIGWTQCLIGETYAAQGSYPQAERAYEQALVTYRRYGQPAANRGRAGGRWPMCCSATTCPCCWRGTAAGRPPTPVPWPPRPPP